MWSVSLKGQFSFLSYLCIFLRILEGRNDKAIKIRTGFHWLLNYSSHILKLAKFAEQTNKIDLCRFTQNAFQIKWGDLKLSQHTVSSAVRSKLCLMNVTHGAVKLSSVAEIQLNWRSFEKFHYVSQFESTTNRERIRKMGQNSPNLCFLSATVFHPVTVELMRVTHFLNHLAIRRRMNVLGEEDVK